MGNLNVEIPTEFMFTLAEVKSKARIRRQPEVVMVLIKLAEKHPDEVAAIAGQILSEGSLEKKENE